MTTTTRRHDIGAKIFIVGAVKRDVAAHRKNYTNIHLTGTTTPDVYAPWMFHKPVDLSSRKMVDSVAIACSGQPTHSEQESRNMVLIRSLH